MSGNHVWRMAISWIGIQTFWFRTSTASLGHISTFIGVLFNLYFRHLKKGSLQAIHEHLIRKKVKQNSLSAAKLLGRLDLRYPSPPFFPFSFGDSLLVAMTTESGGTHTERSHFRDLWTPECTPRKQFIRFRARGVLGGVLIAQQIRGCLWPVIKRDGRGEGGYRKMESFVCVRTQVLPCLIKNVCGLRNFVPIHACTAGCLLVSQRRLE